MMTKADYEITAAAINEVLWSEKSDPATLTLLTVRLMTAYRMRNDKFDSARFMEQAFMNRDTVSQIGSAK